MANFRSALILIAIASLLAAFAVGCSSDESNLNSPINVDTVPPAIPGGISAAVATMDASQAGVRLTWDANVTDPDLAGYTVYRSDSSGSGFRAAHTSPITSNEWTDMHVQPSRTYYYRVTSIDSSNNESATSLSFQVSVPSTLPDLERN